jgi:hypothetical protein
MSEENLQRLLERLGSDEEFRHKLEHDWEAVIDELGLSETERIALTEWDEDALRRLAGSDVSAYGYVGAAPIGEVRVFLSYHCDRDTITWRCQNQCTANRAATCMRL